MEANQKLMYHRLLANGLNDEAKQILKAYPHFAESEAPEEGEEKEVKKALKKATKKAKA